MKNISTTIHFTIILIFPLMTKAHPGHGETDGYTITHYFTAPSHAVITLGSIVILYAMFRFINKEKFKAQK